jgi:hypothetical protein
LSTAAERAPTALAKAAVGKSPSSCPASKEPSGRKEGEEKYSIQETRILFPITETASIAANYEFRYTVG